MRECLLESDVQAVDALGGSLPRVAFLRQLLHEALNARPGSGRA